MSLHLEVHLVCWRKKNKQRPVSFLSFPMWPCVSPYSSQQHMLQVFLWVKDVSQMKVPCSEEWQKTELLWNQRALNDKQRAHCTVLHSTSFPAPQLSIPSLSTISMYIPSMTIIILIYHLSLIILVYWVLSMVHTVF